RPGRRHGMDRARAAQALHRLDLERVPADGARRPARGERPPLPARGEERARGPRRGHGRRLMNRFLLPLGIFALLIALLGIGLTLNPREVPSPLVGKPAPHFELPQLQEPQKTFTERSMLGKVWVLNVW